jgi:hypothetical protein
VALRAVKIDGLLRMHTARSKHVHALAYCK